jgi:hypothetical protein
MIKPYELFLQENNTGPSESGKTANDNSWIGDLAKSLKVHCHCYLYSSSIAMTLILNCSVVLGFVFQIIMVTICRKKLRNSEATRLRRMSEWNRISQLMKNHDQRRRNQPSPSSYSLIASCQMRVIAGATSISSFMPVSL